MISKQEFWKHWSKPRNRGSFLCKERRVVIGKGGSDKHKDVLFLEFNWSMIPCPECSGSGKVASAVVGSPDIEFANCANCLCFGSCYYIDGVRYVSVGCSWLTTSASLFSEYAKKNRVEAILLLNIGDIVTLTGLPTFATHCAVIIKEAIDDALFRGFRCLIDPA